MTVSLVTGGSGFIGGHLVDQLAACGEEVRILDLEPPTKLPSGARFVQGSVTDRAAVGEAMAGVRHVYHTAAVPHLWMPNPSAYEEVNVGGTRVVFEAAIAAGVERVVHTSSAAVLAGGLGGRGPVTLDERHRTVERDLFGRYARSKYRAERLALDHAGSLSVVVVNPTLPLGPNDRHLTPPTRMVLDFVTGRARAFVDTVLNIVDVRDAAAGHRLAARRGRPGERYLLNGHSLGMAAFLRHLERVSGRPMPKRRAPSFAALAMGALCESWSSLVSGRPPLAPLAGVRMSRLPITFDGGRAERELGVQTRPLDETLRDSVAWLLENALVDAAGSSGAAADKR